MKSLYELVAPYDSVSLIGMCKNAGKTTTLNQLIAELKRNGVSFGATSVGRDGESTDLVTNTVKPGIFVPRADGSAPEMLVTHFVWRYRGRQTLKSVGRNPYLAGAGDGATERTLRRLQNSAESKRLTYYSFTNAAALTVRTAEVPAVTISFAAIEDTSAIFLAQLTADAEPDDAALTLTVHYYLNDQQIENFAPQQRMEAGPHTLALFYPFANVEANTVKRLSVRLVCSGGTVRVAQYGIKATVTGQGMASETPWDGTLECEETLLPIAIKARSINV